MGQVRRLAPIIVFYLGRPSTSFSVTLSKGSRALCWGPLGRQSRKWERVQEKFAEKRAPLGAGATSLLAHGPQCVMVSISACCRHVWLLLARARV